MPRSAQRNRARAQVVFPDENFLILEKKRHFLGTARVPIDKLSFEGSSARVLDEKNVERLVSIYKLTACQQLKPSNHIPGILPPEAFSRFVGSIATVQNPLRSDEPSGWPMLIVSEEQQIQCLHGRHRVEAARRCLGRRDQWWVVDFYSTGSLNPFAT